MSQKDIVDNVITALNSNAMIAPNYWVDYKTGNDYFLNRPILRKWQAGDPQSHRFERHPPPGPQHKGADYTRYRGQSGLMLETPTEVDHYQIQRAADIYVTPKGEDLGKIASSIDKVISEMKIPGNVRINLRGMVQGMRESFKSFAFGFILAAILLYLILVAQFRSFIDPFLIMLAIPMGFIGVLLILLLSGTTLNVMSLMGVLMLIGVAGSNSILIVDFAHKLEEQNLSVGDAVITACRVRLRPILMTSLATIIGMFPMALKLGTGSEQYAPMARAIIGGLTSSVILTVFIVPAAYLLVYRKKDRKRSEQGGPANA